MHVTPVEIFGVVFIDHLEETATDVGYLHVGKIAACALKFSGQGAGLEAREERRAADNVESQVGKWYVSKVIILCIEMVNAGVAVHFDGSSALRAQSQRLWSLEALSI